MPIRLMENFRAVFYMRRTTRLTRFGSTSVRGVDVELLLTLRRPPATAVPKLIDGTTDPEPGVGRCG